MKSVVYLTCTKLPCIGTSQANVVICIKDTIELVSGLNNLPAFLLVSTEIHDDCNVCNSYWRYTLSYDENLLEDPETLLTSDDITGLFCKTCFTDWIESFSGGLPVVTFKTIDVPTGTNPVAASVTDTLTFLAGPNVTITGDELTDEITFALTGVSLLAFSTINCPTGTDPVADSSADTLNLTADSNVTVTGTAGTDTIEFGLSVSVNNTYLISRNFADSANLNLLKADADDNTVLNAVTGKNIVFAINGTTELFVGNDSLSFIGTDFIIGSNSVNGTDNRSLGISAASSPGADRSAYINFNGNEYTSNPGDATLSSGTVSGGSVQVNVASADGVFVINTGAGINARWSVDPVGDLISDATTGGNAIITATNKGVLVGAVAVDADETGFGNVPALYIRTASSGRGHIVLNGTAAIQTGPVIYGLKTRSVDGSADVIVADQDQVYNFSGWGADGTVYRNMGNVTLRVDGTPGVDDMPSQWAFSVRPPGAGAVLAEALILKPNRWLEIPNTAAAPGVNPTAGGYLYVEAGALKFRGSGGTVTVVAPA